MRLKQPSDLTPEETMATMNCEKAYRLAWDCNAVQAAEFFKQMPWALCIITPTRIFFRH